MNSHRNTRPHSRRVGNTRIFEGRHRHHALADPYHFVLTLTWPRFFSALLLAYLALNLIFALIYWQLPGSVNNIPQGDFIDYFFFSVETLATVGYGVMSPATVAGHVVASIEILLGMVSAALTTGMVFARFSRPTARLLFSNHALIRTFEGRRMLMLRVANARFNRIVDASATLSLLRQEASEDGERFLRIYDLVLERDSSPVFSFTWTLMHIIDHNSPLHKITTEQLMHSECSIVVSIIGHDETMAATLHAGHQYRSKDIAFDGRFADILHVGADGNREIDLTRFHQIIKTPPSGSEGH